MIAASFGTLFKLPASLLRAATTPHPFSGGTPSRRRSRSESGCGRKKFWLSIGGKKVIFDQRQRPAAGYAQTSPVVDGQRMRWEAGDAGEPTLVPRVAPSGRTKKKRAPKANAAPAARRRVYDPSKGVRRLDAKGAARAARRAGVISPRQQRKVHKGARYAHRQAAIAELQAAAAESGTAIA
ncbi:MAG: hypothetical protein HOQ02_04570 [Lysobacter sp.]|nr:hypothetical protein [Lysobacter sp.]